MMSRIFFLLSCLTCLNSMFRSYASVRLENLTIRHQIAVYKQSIPRPKLKPVDRMLWVWLPRLWPGWQQALECVQPRTVIAWQNKRFRDYWRKLSQSGKPGRPPSTKKSVPSSRPCGEPSPPGAHLVLSARSVSSASTWPNPRERSIGHATVNRRHPHGRSFWPTMSRISWYVTFSPCRLPVLGSYSCSSCL